MYVDLQMYTNSNESPDPSAYFQGWTCENRNSSANQWNSGNDGRYCNEEYDALFVAYAAELDPAKRAAAAIALNDLLIADNMIFPLVNRATPQVKLKTLEGPTFDPTFDSLLWNIATWKRVP